MRITFVTPGLTFSGGMLAIVAFANGLAARGHSVTLVSPRVWSAALVQSIGSHVRIVSTRSSIQPSSSNAMMNAFLAVDLASVIPHSDALVATYTPTAIPVLLAAGVGRGIPYWIYADYLEMFSSRPIERLIIRELPRHFRKVVTYSQASVDELLGVANVRATVVGLGLPRRHLFTPPCEKVARPPTALYVGDARPRKGLSDFLAAAAIVQKSVPDLRLQIVTKDHPSIRSSVPFDHLVAPDDGALADLYRGCGVFVSTSWFEGLGVPPLEAMACGAPVVLTDQRGARDYAVDGVNALVVPIQAPQKVAEAMVRVLGDSALAQRLGRCGIETAQRYSWESALDRFETVIGARRR